jgi:flagellar hook assembly protein FlgD
MIYNALGQRVKRIVQEGCNAGHHTVVWNGMDDRGRQMASGVYIYRLEAADKTATRKMILLK